MFHTQENRGKELTNPIKTVNPESWLGDGYYFWYYFDDAQWWGQTAKKSKYYHVYAADINCDNVLDTVFNEEHYNLWVKQIQKFISKILKHNRNITLKYLNDRFREAGVYTGVDGVMFQDISDNDQNWIVKKFQYKKRIQLAVYNLHIIGNFALDFDSRA
jgi:hypothetical protein